MKFGFSRAPRRSHQPLGDDHKARVERRRAAATGLVGAGSDAARHVADAPPGYLLVHDSGDIARHCELLSPLPRPSEVRVVATPARIPGEWHLDVASRDRPGLLAAFTGVLSTAAIDVVQAVLATWDDGGALEAFIVRTDEAPDETALERAFVASLSTPHRAQPVADAIVTFDDHAASLYTRCDIHAPDRPGLLHAFAVAIATAGADVHAAKVATAEGVAHDVFDLSDPCGRKLGADLQNVIRACLDGTVVVSR